jgi:chitin disaccharide deacetylase
MSKRLIVCADDYAFTAGVSRSIRELLAARRISATSVMTTMPDWPGEADALRAVAGNADIGLHVTLTDHRPLGAMPTFAPEGKFPPMPAVHKAGALRRLPVAELKAELHRQAERFVAVWGKPPAHIDGHHHVQQLPGVREIIIDLAASMSPRPWVRAGNDRLAVVMKRGVAVPKALVIGAFGGAVTRRAVRAGVTTNVGFSGAYDFAGDTRPLSELFQRFIIGARENTLVMCHPGYSDAALAKLDGMVEARDREHAFFMSKAWPRIVAEAGLEIGPLRRT